MERLPQTLVNVDDVDKSRVEEDGILAAAVAEEEAALGDSGRILLRPSGTEPLVRVMVEATTAGRAPTRSPTGSPTSYAATRPLSPLSLARAEAPLPRVSRVTSLEIREVDVPDEAALHRWWEAGARRDGRRSRSTSPTPWEIRASQPASTAR